MSEGPCRESGWSDVLIFFLGSIISHAATVPPSPGSTVRDIAEKVLLAILVPYYGVGRAVIIILRGALLQKTPLQQAARAGALCVVGRTRKWKPEGRPVRTEAGQKQFSNIFDPDKEVSEQKLLEHPFFFCRHFGYGRNPSELHGQWDITEEYAIYLLGSAVEVEEFPREGPTSPVPENPPQSIGATSPEISYQGPPRAEATSPTTQIEESIKSPALGVNTRDSGTSAKNKQLNVKLPSNHSLIKPLISIFQIIYASVDIYQSRGSQIFLYGYGAYSFVVIPYILMSFMNLIAAIWCPEYPCYFLVESKIMIEARDRGCFFNGIVGRVKTPDTDATPPADREEKQDIIEREIVDAIIGPRIVRKPSDYLKSNKQRISMLVACLLTVCVISGPFIIVAALTGFHSRQSTFSQTGWLLVWFPINLVAMALGGVSIENRRGGMIRNAVTAYHVFRKLRSRAMYVIYAALAGCCLTAPTLWVFYVTGMSIMESTICKEI